MPKGKFDLAAALAKQLSAISVDRDGKKGFDALKFFDVRFAVEESFEFLGDLPLVEKRRISYRAAMNAAAVGKLTVSGLRVEARKLREEFLSKPKNSYELMTTLSIRNSQQSSTCQLNGTRFRFSKTVPTRFSRDPMREKLDLHPIADIPENYTVVRVRCSGRTEAAAVEQATDALDLLRGIWNFTLNRTRGGNLLAITSVFPKSVNRVLLGPVHTLHHSDGGIAADTYWFEQQTSQLPTPFAVEKQWSLMRREAAAVRKLLRSISFRSDLQEAFIRYSRALDFADHESSLLKLWGILEFLTATVGGPYDKTIRRALFLYGDRELKRVQLEHLRLRRNQSVHSGSVSNDMESFVFQLKEYVENMLVFLLRNGKGFDGLSDAGEWLQLPVDRNVLERNISRTQRALEFLGV